MSVVCLQCNAIEHLYKDLNGNKQQQEYETACLIFSSFKSVQSNCSQGIVELALSTQDWPEDLFIVLAKFLCTFDIINKN